MPWAGGSLIVVWLLEIATDVPILEPQVMTMYRLTLLRTSTIYRRLYPTKTETLLVRNALRREY